MSLWHREAPFAQTPPPVLHRALSLPFRAWTERLYVAGMVVADDRLSDVLNRREPIQVEDAIVVPIGSPLTAGSRRREVVLDPFEFDFVLGGTQNTEARNARLPRHIYKVRHPVIIEGTTFVIRGILHQFPGNAPESAAHRTSTLFLPVTEASVRRDGRLVSGPETEVALVNRFAIRDIRPLDKLN
jgi:hypothetical protein